jgi:hypothetical protein
VARVRPGADAKRNQTASRGALARGEDQAKSTVRKEVPAPAGHSAARAWPPGERGQARAIASGSREATAVTHPNVIGALPTAVAGSAIRRVHGATLQLRDRERDQQRICGS